MLVTLETPYADTTAADLSFALGLPEQPALHVLDLTGAGVGDVALRLRLLGASHQVVLGVGDREVVETVACLPGRPADLPPLVREQAIGYRFTARVRRLDADAMSERVGRLRRELSDDPYALVGVFPGSPDAVTALQAWPGRPAGTTGPGAAGRVVGWRTWHAYPQTGELVETETEVVL